jgi:cell wall-active antibiotic response 4TMS protein YvqF
MRYGYRSFFWPALLILVGVFALLVNSGLVAPERLDRLADLWPLILIVIGLELLVRRTLQGANAELAAVLIVVLAITGAAAYVALGPSIPTGSRTLDVSGKLGSLKQASVRVAVDAAQITMEGADIGADLYRAHVVYSGNTPDVAFAESNGDLQILQGNSSGFFFKDRRFVLDLKLNIAVIWKIAVDSGASTDSFNLAHAPVAGIELHTGASREDITVGAPSGSVPITVDGGALTVNVHRPKGVAASVAVSGGAVNLTFDGRQSHAIGTVTAQTSDYNGASDRYQIQVNGGASNVTVDASASAG